MPLPVGKRTGFLLSLTLAGLVACASRPSPGVVNRPHPELDVNLELEPEVQADPEPARVKPKSTDAAEIDDASIDAQGDVPEQGTSPPETIEESAERLLISLGESVERHKLYYEEDVRIAIGQMNSREIEDLIGPTGYVDKDVNLEGPLHCTRDEIREKVDMCAKMFVRLIQRYKQFRDNKRFPPGWSRLGDFSVLSFSSYELYFGREPFGLKEVQYHNRESGH